MKKQLSGIRNLKYDLAPVYKKLPTDIFFV